jgi:hypothetical protein
VKIILNTTKFNSSTSAATTRNCQKGVKKEKTAKENQNGGNIYTN